MEIEFIIYTSNLVPFENHALFYLIILNDQYHYKMTGS